MVQKKKAAPKKTVSKTASTKTASKKAVKAPVKRVAAKSNKKACNEKCAFWSGIVIAIFATAIFALFAYGVGQMLK